MRTKEQIIDLLLSTGREGMAKLIKWLEKDGFFEAPASTKFHSGYSGGLADHSKRVYELLMFYSNLKLDAVSVPGQKPLPLKKENLIIAGLLHDVCKIGAYVRTKAGDDWTNNRKKEKGHALLSLERIKKFIKLEPIEELMITYHMGFYGLIEFDEKSGEYPLRGDHLKDGEMSKEDSQKARYGKSMANAWFHNPVCKVIYFCDELATLEEKAKGDL